MKRRTFIKAVISGGLLMAASGSAACSRPARAAKMINSRNPRKAAVVWYSQTGHTARIGRIIAHAWQQAGLTVDSGDYRDIDAASLAGYDLIAIGTPVFYMDVPENLGNWLKKVRAAEGTPVAAFVTFGGHGDGQHNTSCRLLEQMSDAGATPVGIGMFGNMSTFAPTWSSGNSARTLKYKHLPNADTYRQAKAFADNVIKDVAGGQTIAIDRKFGLDSIMAALPQVPLTKLAITNHHIDLKTCIGCGACVKKCAVAAINLKTGIINSPRCIACMGCVNNCPTGAMKMNFGGKEVYGFNEFLKRNHIDIIEPLPPA
jgi:ferredoxin/flavodoxin